MRVVRRARFKRIIDLPDDHNVFALLHDIRRRSRARARRGIAIACVAAASSVRAQSAQAFSLQASVLYCGLSGEAYAGFKPGSGYEGQLRYTSTFGFSFGAGYQYTIHAIDGASANASLAGPFVEPRFTVEIKGHENLFPYGSLRLSSLRQNISANGISSSASGFTGNAGGGLLVRVTSRANLDVGATFGLTKFSDFVLVDPSTGQRIVGGKTGSGSNFVLRTGLAIGLF